MTDAAPGIPTQNATMLRISEDEFPDGLQLRPFIQRRNMVAACVVDEPFRVESGEYYSEAFDAGDYVLFAEFGLIGMPAERFTALYESAMRDHLGTFDAYADASGIHLEPTE